MFVLPFSITEDLSDLSGWHSDSACRHQGFLTWDLKYVSCGVPSRSAEAMSRWRRICLKDGRFLGLPCLQKQQQHLKQPMKLCFTGHSQLLGSDWSITANPEQSIKHPDWFAFKIFKSTSDFKSFQLLQTFPGFLFIY